MSFTVVPSGGEGVQEPLPIQSDRITVSDHSSSLEEMERGIAEKYRAVQMKPPTTTPYSDEIHRITSAWLNDVDAAVTTDVTAQTVGEAAGTASLDDSGNVVITKTCAPSGTPPKPRKRSRKPTDGSVKSSIRSKRRRVESTNTPSGPPQVARVFHRSQRVLRREAPNINMKEVMSRSLASLDDARSDDVETNPFSPTMLSPTTSSLWSPALVGDITNRFLASVQHQRKQNCARLVQREWSQTKPSQSNQLPSKDGLHQSDEPDDELVIDDEDANWIPPRSDDVMGSVSNGDGLADRNQVAGDRSLSRLPSYLGDASLSSHPNASGDGSEISEEAMVKALARKHEMWKLKQRQIKAQRMLEKDPNSKIKDGGVVTGDGVSATDAKGTGLPLTGSTMRKAVTTVETVDTLESLHATLSYSQKSSRQSHSISQMSSLSSSDISLICRLNNFDNTSSRNVVVFGSAASQKSQGSM